MKSKIQNLLLPFYFGSVGDSDRLTVERELLTDSEVLVDFLDLKRSLESAELVPQGPSLNVWAKLSQHSKLQKKWVWTLSFGAGLVAASVILFIALSKTSVTSFPDATRVSSPEILFDSSSELPASSNVL